MRRIDWALLVMMGLLSAGCGYRYFATPLNPLPEAEHGPEMKVSDDGTVTYVRERLEISLRPMTDAELNRQFSKYSKGGPISTNPYTYGDWKDWGETWTPTRFTVFQLKVKNYTYPKVWVDPSNITIAAKNGRKYRPLSLMQLEQYYIPYAIGYGGVDYKRFEERKDILKATLYRAEFIFSGQEKEGYVVFPKLDDDVSHIRIQVEDVVLRFNVFNEPIDTINATFLFQRTVYKAREPRT